MKTAAFKINLTIHYLFIGIWVGALVGFVFAAISAFAIARQYQLAIGIAPYNAAVFSSHSADILAGGVVSYALVMIKWVQVVCAAVLVVTTALFCTLFSSWIGPGLLSKRNLLRMALVITVVIIMAITQFVIFPHMGSLRNLMYDPNLAATARHAARLQFNQHHLISQNLTTIMVILLVMIAFLTSFTFGKNALKVSSRCAS